MQYVLNPTVIKTNINYKHRNMKLRYNSSISYGSLANREVGST